MVNINVTNQLAICNDSEVYRCSNCDCDELIVDLGRLYSKNKIKSVDGSISISTFNIPNGTRCGDDTGLNLETNEEFYINGHQVFCKSDSEPYKRGLCLEAIGAELEFSPDDCTGCCGSSCEKLTINVTDASLAKGMRVGCITDSEAQLQTKLVKKPNGYIDWLFDCSDFTVQLADPNGDNGGVADQIKIYLISKPVYSINGQVPNSAGDFKICAGDAIEINTSGSMCSSQPGVEVNVLYDSDDFELNADGELSLKAVTSQTEYLVYGALGTTISIDTRVEASGTPITSDPDWQVGAVVMDIWEKVVSAGANVVVPYTAPAGYKWVLDINIQVDAYPLFPSSGTIASAVPASGVVQAKAYVNNSLVSDVSGQQRECHPYSIAPAAISRGDGVIKGVFNIPQTMSSSVPINIVFQYSTPAATKDTMWRVESREISYSGFLKLIKS